MTSTDHQVGDHVRDRRTRTQGKIVAVEGQTLRVDLGRGQVVEREADGVVNFSLNARKAWATKRDQGQPEATREVQPGDRVRDRATRETGRVVRVEAGKLVVAFADRGEVTCDPDAVVNFSLNGRKAWATKRGRDERAAERAADPLVNVTVRVRGSVWDALGDAHKTGILALTREALINAHLEQVARALGVWPPSEE